jgi:dGTP triphosphohydrolase
MLWQRAWQVAQEDCPDARPIHKQIRACKAVLSAMADDAIRTTGENLRKLSDENGCRGHDVCDHAEASKVVGVAANVAVTAPGTAGTAPGGVAANSAATAPDDATAPNLTLDAIRRCGRRVVGFSSELAKEVDQMRDFLMEHVYVHPLAEEQKIPCRRMIRELFGAFTSQPGLLPPRYQQRVGDESLHRVVCDYIAGMTDRYCRLEHERVVGTPLP